MGEKVDLEMNTVGTYDESMDDVTVLRPAGNQREGRTLIYIWKMRGGKERPGVLCSLMTASPCHFYINPFLRTNKFPSRLCLLKETSDGAGVEWEGYQMHCGVFAAVDSIKATTSHLDLLMMSNLIWNEAVSELPSLDHMMQL